MKVFQVTFDATVITVVAENKKQVHDMVSEKDKGFEKRGQDLYYRWGENYIDKCEVIELSMMIPLIVHWESH